MLATIDDRETQTGVQRSQAQVSQADAELRNAQANAERTRELQAKGFVSKARSTPPNCSSIGPGRPATPPTPAPASRPWPRATPGHRALDGWVLQTPEAKPAIWRCRASR